MKVRAVSEPPVPVPAPAPEPPEDEPELDAPGHPRASSEFSWFWASVRLVSSVVSSSWSDVSSFWAEVMEARSCSSWAAVPPCSAESSVYWAALNAAWAEASVASASVGSRVPRTWPALTV